ncbi:DNA breaking-rejoining protein [Cypionkella sinensis]|uniref:DNA breaking-rejoining protein n=1 Tax=Cypionkella sinensis TaxID=1756043 RepID=A0ABV7J345_9RHOB
MTLRRFSRIAALLLIVGGSPALADDIRREAVQFARGASGSTIKSKVKGYDSVQYSLRVTAGQKMSVQLDCSNASLYFNITAPGASEALYNSSIDGNGATVTIPSSGKYLIDVYLMRNAARRGETANYTLTLYVE